MRSAVEIVIVLSFIVQVSSGCKPKEVEPVKLDRKLDFPKIPELRTKQSDMQRQR